MGFYHEYFSEVLNENNKRTRQFIEQTKKIQNIAQSVSDKSLPLFEEMNSYGFLTIESAEGLCDISDKMEPVQSEDLTNPRILKEAKYFKDKEGNDILVISLQKANVQGWLPQMIIGNFKARLAALNKGYIVASSNEQQSSKTYVINNEFMVPIDKLDSVSYGLKARVPVDRLSEASEAYLWDFVNPDDDGLGYGNYNPKLASDINFGMKENLLAYVVVIDNRPCRDGKENLFVDVAKVLREIDFPDMVASM